MNACMQRVSALQHPLQRHRSVPASSRPASCLPHRPTWVPPALQSSPAACRAPAQSMRSDQSWVCRAADAAMPMPETAHSGSSVSKVLANVRACLFGAWTFTLAVPLFVVMLALSPFVMIFDKYRRLAEHFVNNLWAIFSTIPFYSVQIIGKENLPSSATPVVYVANHQSFMDIYSLFHLQRPFKFISKTSNFLIPIVGWSMFLTGHVMLNRVDRKSQLECLKTCIMLLNKGASVLFFPEGTRSKDRKMGGFKKGAFSVAVKAGVPIVPITLVGTGDVMPNGQEGQMYPGQVNIIVHPPIQTTGQDADQVCEAARKQIASSLPPELVGDGKFSDA
eukprot:jgi/Chrzof1/5418/Cz16g02090.t1